MEIILLLSQFIWLYLAFFSKLKLKYKYLSFILLWITYIFLIIYKVGLLSIFYVFSILFLISCFLLSFLSSRIYNYLLATIFLCFTIISLALGLKHIAEILGGIVFLFLVLGIIRDTLYDKIFEN